MTQRRLTSALRRHISLVARAQMMGMDQVSISDRMGCIYILSTVYMFVVILTTMAQCTPSIA